MEFNWTSWQFGETSNFAQIFVESINLAVDCLLAGPDQERKLRKKRNPTKRERRSRGDLGTNNKRLSTKLYQSQHIHPQLPRREGWVKGESGQDRRSRQSDRRFRGGQSSGESMMSISTFITIFQVKEEPKDKEWVPPNVSSATSANNAMNSQQLSNRRNWSKLA